MRCPSASCKRRVPMTAWVPYVQEEQVASYKKSAEGLMNFRCGNCDQTGTLLVDGIAESERPDKMKTFVSQIKATGGVNSLLALKKEWDRFANGATVADEVLDAILKGFHLKDIAELAHLENEVLERALGLIPDVERRCMLHLAFLRRCPKIR